MPVARLVTCRLPSGTTAPDVSVRRPKTVPRDSCAHPGIAATMDATIRQKRGTILRSIMKTPFHSVNCLGGCRFEGAVNGYVECTDSWEPKRRSDFIAAPQHASQLLGRPVTPIGETGYHLEIRVS